MTQQKKRWNLFARELEDILTLHNLHLGYLDDCRIGLHREKVRRLQQSLLTPKSFPVLNPEELELIIEKFSLSKEERVRLRAALLATAIERMLMDRIDQENALLASEQIAAILRDHLLAHFEQNSGTGATRDGDGEAKEDDEDEQTWWRAREAFDEGNLALNLSYGIDLERESTRCAREAETCFTEALTELESLNEDWKSLQNWKIWHDDVDAGLALTKKRLKDLGEE